MYPGAACPDPVSVKLLRRTPYAARRTVFLEPPRDDDLLVGEELHAVGAVRLEVAEERALGAAEREERHRRGDPDVHAHHRHAGAVAELSRRLAAAGEDRRRVGEGALVDELDRL